MTEDNCLILWNIGPTNDVNNYRPISILPVISKILERHIAFHLRQFLEANLLLHESQSGFRADHSCETALLHIVDKWISSINNHESVASIFLDLSKAFDLVNHSILLQKLKLYNFGSSALKWFSSYLSQRSQKVSINGHLSEPQDVSAGVPQGSVLGPLLFVIYINDLPLHTGENTLVDMFADDTTISAHNTCKQEVHETLQTSLNAISHWCSDNSMKLNTSKTKSMYILSSNRQTTQTNTKFTLQADELDNSTNEKLLGVTVDNHLSFKMHIENTLKKCNSLLYLLLRIKSFLNLDTRKLFFNAYILPHIDYCCTVWGNSSMFMLDKILKFQKRAARIILDKNFDEPSADLFRQLHWMTIYERIEYKTSLLVYKGINKNSPHYISSKFSYVSGERQLRSSSNNLLYLPKPKMELFRKGISYAGPKIWNALPLNIRTADSITTFKTLYIQHKFPNWANSN